MLTSCWDVKDLEDYNFITALGIEKLENKFVVYTEILDVSSVGKQESGVISEMKAVWVGRAEGRTVMDAMAQIYRTSQQRLMWDHIVTIVLSEDMLREDLRKVLGSIFRFREIRYTPWVYAAHGSIEQIMRNPTFINESPMATLAHQPKELFKQTSYYIPTRMLNVSRYYDEPGASLLIPSLKIAEASWKNDLKRQPVLMVDGAYAVRHSNVAWLPNEQLEGILWSSRSIRRTTIPIMHNGKAIGTARLGSPRSKISVTYANGRPVFRMHISIRGFIQELDEEHNEAELQAYIEKEISKDVFATYKSAIAKQVDIYQFAHYLYTKHNSEWKRLKSQNGAIELDANSLAKVDVDIHLLHSGMYRLD